MGAGRNRFYGDSRCALLVEAGAGTGTGTGNQGTCDIVCCVNVVVAELA